MAETVWAKAKAEIERRGWHQGWFYDRQNPDMGSACVCLAGAICTVTTGFPYKDSHFAAEEPLRVLGRRIGSRRSIADWNDDPDRTLDEVYVLLDELDAAEREATDA